MKEKRVPIEHEHLSFFHFEPHDLRFRAGAVTKRPAAAFKRGASTVKRRPASSGAISSGDVPRLCQAAAHAYIRVFLFGLCTCLIVWHDKQIMLLTVQLLME